MKNILFIMADQLRNDYVGYMNKRSVDTPNIDKIASRCYFSGCVTQNPLCTPARSSLITGRYSRQIGMLAMSGDLYPQIPTFMQALQKAGYITYGIGKYHYVHHGGVSNGRGKGPDHVAMVDEMKKLGYDFVWETAGKQTMLSNYCHYAEYLNNKGLLNKLRDFIVESGGINGDTADHNFDKANPAPLDEEDYIDVVTARVAREQLKKHPSDKPFYMYLSFCGPHKTYDAPQRYLDMFPLEKEDDFNIPDGQVLTDEQKETIYRQRRSYKAMIKLIDDQIGLVLSDLEERDLLKDTLILFASDHGDMQGDHYMIQKGVPWKEATNVPLAAYLPGAPVVGEVAHTVQLNDIAATILEYAGLNPTKVLSREFPAYNDRIPSCSFLSVLKGEAERNREWSYCESDFTEEVNGNTTIEEVMEKRGGRIGGGKRSNDWRMVVTDTSKYIKYLGYDTPGCAYEEFYDLSVDPGETNNLIGNPEYEDRIREAKNRMEFVIDKYPPAQKTWVTAFATDRKYN